MRIILRKIVLIYVPKLMNNHKEKECVFCVHFVHFVTTFPEPASMLDLRASFCTKWARHVVTFVHSCFFLYIYRGMRQSMTPEASTLCKFVTKVVTKWAKNAQKLGVFWVWLVFYCVAVRFCVRIWAKNAPYLYHKMPAGCWCGIFVYKNGLNCGQKMPEI